MDDHNFDELTRSLAVPSRRSIISSVGAALLAVLAGSGEGDALRKTKQPKIGDSRPGPTSVHASGKGKKRKKKKKQKTPTTQPAPVTPICPPNCSGKNCGPDGCGGLCGFGCGKCSTST